MRLLINHDKRWLMVKRVTWARAMMCRILADAAEAAARKDYMEAQAQFYANHGENAYPTIWMKHDGTLMTSDSIVGFTQKIPNAS